MEFHEVANIFPLMDEPTFRQLVEDIRANGQREPIWVHEGRIIDGRNRYRACLEAGVEPVTQEWDRQGDLVAFAVSLNLHRRHLNESQRAMAAAKIRETLEAGANLHPGDTAEQAASAVNVSRRSVFTAAKVIDQGAPELVAAVESGEVAVSTAARLAELPQAEQAEIVARGEKEILAAARKIRAEREEQRRGERFEKIAAIAQGNAPLEAGPERYPVIYADPAWRYDFVSDNADAIENHYPTMDLDAICALPVKEIATDDAILFLWTTAPKLEEAFKVIEAWGFTYKSNHVWHKSGMGMGYYGRVDHEHLLIATRGTIPVPSPQARPTTVRQLPKTEHSAKPGEYAEMIERMYPGLPKLEMFCRSPREGWHVWGNQSESATA